MSALYSIIILIIIIIIIIIMAGMEVFYVAGSLTYISYWTEH